MQSNGREEGNGKEIAPLIQERKKVERESYGPALEYPWCAVTAVIYSSRLLTLYMSCHVMDTGTSRAASMSSPWMPTDSLISMC